MMLVESAVQDPFLEGASVIRASVNQSVSVGIENSAGGNVAEDEKIILANFLPFLVIPSIGIASIAVSLDIWVQNHLSGHVCDVGPSSHLDHVPFHVSLGGGSSKHFASCIGV